MKKFIILSLVSSALFTGCAQNTNQDVMLYSDTDGYSIDYKEGHNEGCASGKNNYVRNQKLYDFNSQYRYGWNAGYSKCHAEFLEKK